MESEVVNPGFTSQSEELEYYKKRVRNDGLHFNETMDLYVTLILYKNASKLTNSKACEHLMHAIDKLEDILEAVCTKHCGNAVLGKRILTEILVDEMIIDRE